MTDGPVISFTKFPTYSVKELFGSTHIPQRIGVPGSPTFDYSSVWSTLSFRGTCFQAVLKSSMMYIHLLIFLGMGVVNSEFDSPRVRGARIPDFVFSTVQTVAVFCVVFFTTRVYGRFNERFHDVCKTNGGVTVVSSLTTGYLRRKGEKGRAIAISLCRYTIAILHIYYYLISGPMDRFKWGELVKKGVLTKQETARLEVNASPGVVVYAWCASLLQDAQDARMLTEMQANRIEENISTVRGLAAKQIAYTITQVPLVYFSFITVCSHVFLLMTSWRAAQEYAASRRAPPAACAAAEIDAGAGASADAGAQGYLCLEGYSVMIIICQLWLVYLFSGLYMAAVWMADPMGTRAANYDLAIDLHGLWNEAQNAILAMLQGAQGGGMQMVAGGDTDADAPEMSVPAVEVVQGGFKLKAS